MSFAFNPKPEADAVRHELVSAVVWDELVGSLDDPALLERLGVLAPDAIDKAYGTAVERVRKLHAKPDKPMLLKLAEHVAIRFALDSYEKGELRVNAVKQLLDRMNTEIEALRKILGTQEEMMAHAGLSVQSYTELLDQEFWEQVPEENIFSALL